MVAPPCADNPGPWGAGVGPADVEVAKAGCAVCRFREGCLDRYAATIKPGQVQQVEGLVVAGLYGQDLVSAVRARVKARAA